MNFLIWRICIITTLSVTMNAAEVPFEISRVNNGQKKHYNKHDLIAFRTNGLDEAVKHFNKGDYSQALSAALGTRNYSQPLNAWDISCECQDAVSFLIAYSCLEVGHPQRGLDDLKRVCNRLILPHFSVITSQEIEEKLWQKITSLSTKNAHLSQKLVSETLYYQHVTTRTAQDLFKQKVEQLLNRDTNNNKTACTHSPTFDQILHNNYIQNNPSHHLMYLYCSYIDALEKKNVSRQNSIVNTIKKHNDAQARFRQICIDLIAADKNDFNRIHSNAFYNYIKLEKQNNVNDLAKKFLASDAPYVEPLLEKLLAIQPYKADAIRFFLGFVHFHNGQYKKAYNCFSQIPDSPHLLVRCKTFEAFNKSHDQIDLETVKNGLAIITSALSAKTSSDYVQEQWTCLMKTYVPFYSTLLLEDNDIENVLTMTHCLTNRKITYSQGVEIVNRVFDHSKNSDNKEKDFNTILQSKAFKTIENHAQTTKDETSMICVSALKTANILLEVTPEQNITEADYRHIERALAENKYTQEEKDLLHTLCGNYFCTKSIDQTSYEKQLSYADKAIEFNNSLAITQKALLLREKADAETINNFVAQLKQIAAVCGPQQARALHALSIIYSEEKTGEKAVFSSFSEKNNKISFEYAQSAYDLGHEHAAETLAIHYNYGIKNGDDTWFITPSAQKACQHLEIILKKQATNIDINYRLAYAYMKRGQKYHSKAHACFNTIITSDTAPLCLKADCLWAMGYLALHDLRNNSSVAKAVECFDKAASVDSQCFLNEKIIDESVVAQLALYIHDEITRNKRDTSFVTLCRYIGLILIKSSHETRKQLAVECLDYAAQNNDLKAQLTFVEFAEMSQEHSFKCICYLNEALKTILKKDPSDPRKEYIEYYIIFLQPSLLQKYEFIKYLANNNKTGEIDSYLESKLFSVIKFTHEVLLKNDDTYALDCQNTGLLNQYVTAFQNNKNEKNIRGTLLYAYLLATSNSMQDIQKSSSFFSQILDIPEYNIPDIQQLLAFTHYKRGKLLLDLNQTKLGILFLQKSAELCCLPAILFLAQKWCDKDQLTEHFSLQQINSWLKRGLELPAITEKDKQKVNSLIEQCNEQLRQKMLVQPETTVLIAATGAAVYFSHNKDKPLTKRLIAKEIDQKAFDAEFISLCKSTESAKPNQARIETLSALVVKKKHPHATIMLCPHFMDDDILLAYKYAEQACEYGIRQQTKRSARFLDGGILTNFVELIDKAKQTPFLSFIKEQLVEHKINLTDFVAYVQLAINYDLTQDQYWQRS